METEIRLNRRSVEILQLIADGWEQNDLAEKYGISVCGVKRLRKMILDSLGADNIANAVAMGFRKGMIQ